MSSETQTHATPALAIQVGNDKAGNPAWYGLRALPTGDGGEPIWQLVRPPREGETEPVTYECHEDEWGLHCTCRGHTQHGHTGRLCKHLTALVGQGLLTATVDQRWGMV